MKYVWLTILLWLCALPATARQSAPFDPHAVWISPGYAEDTVLRPSPLFRKIFSCGKAVASATLRITAHGLYEATLNDRRVGDAYFTPGWTNYEKRLQYQVYDLTRQLQRGGNQLVVTLGEGWYRGVFGGWMRRDNYGSDASLLCQLDITYADGST
ncbi:MAG TPA: alpha-L-rhamnosidase N-terminal domain-containing protein, partial [Chitinophaga sp.]